MEQYQTKSYNEGGNQGGLDFLAQMTFDLGTILEEIHDLDIDNLPFEVMAEAFSTLNSTTSLVEEEELPPPFIPATQKSSIDLPMDTPGLIYRVDKGLNTFCVRAISSQSLEQDYLELQNKKETLWKALKLELPNANEEVEKSLSSLYFFPTDTFAEASTLQDNLINRRFPISEDDLFNISDPGLSWWLEMNETEPCFDVYFKSQGIEREERYIKLGPIGDRKMATKRFQEARDWFFAILPINEYIITDKHFRFKTVDVNNPVFVALKDLFISGEFTFTVDMFSEDASGKTLYLYLKEISLLRRFWLEIQEILVH
jgi:hypothetical protein